MRLSLQSPLRSLARAAVALAAIAAAAPASAQLDKEDFRIRSAQDLVDLCAVKSTDSLYSPAIHFCEGFVSGAWQYHQAQANGPRGIRLGCPPDPPPTRDQAVADFVAWSGTHAQYMTDPAVEAFFRFLIEKYPCPQPPPAKSKKGAKK